MSPEPHGRTRVLILARPAEGGIRTHIVSLLRHIDGSRYKVTVAGPVKLLDSLRRDLPDLATVNITVTAKPSLSDPRAIYQLTDAVRRGGLVVHAQGIRAGFIAALARCFLRFPLIVTYHNVPPETRMTTAVLRLIESKSAHSIAVSDAIAERLPGVTIAVIPNGIDVSAFTEVDRESARQDLRIDPAESVVVCVARLSVEKGVDVLLEAARSLPDVLFVVAGDGPERERLTRAAPQNVRFLGYVPDVRATLSAADVVAIPSLSEGQGIVALEAMACGVPVIASAVGGLVETITNGATGMLVTPNDPQGLADCIRCLLSDLPTRRSITNAGRVWVQEDRRVEQQVRRTEAIYDQVLAATSDAS